MAIKPEKNTLNLQKIALLGFALMHSFDVALFFMSFFTIFFKLTTELWQTY